MQLRTSSCAVNREEEVNGGGAEIEREGEGVCRERADVVDHYVHV